MKIAIPNNGNIVNQHFGTSKSFVIVTVENKEIQSIEEISTSELAHKHEKLADLFVKHNVTAVITGGIGGGALAGLQQNGFNVIKGASGEYRVVVQKYINGTLENKNTICNHHCDN